MRDNPSRCVEDCLSFQAQAILHAVYPDTFQQTANHTMEEYEILINFNKIISQFVVISCNDLI